MTSPLIGRAGADEPVRFGMDVQSIDAQQARGVAPDYAVFWVGPWTLQHGWGGPDQWMTQASAEGVTPVIQFYYWGDDISRDGLEDGCWSSLHDAQKTRAGWQQLAEELVAHLHSQMGGDPAVIVLETEFNKNDVTTYEPLDTYLAEKADYFHDHYPAATVALGLGNWGRADWATWDQAAAATDVGSLQALRGSTRDSLSTYRGVVDETMDGIQRYNSLFGQPVLLSDLALSTYPEPEYLGHQDDVIESFLSRLDELKGAGLVGLIYRSFWDDPNFDTANYYGQAERHWGLAWPGSETTKPAFEAWKQGVLAERSGSSPLSSKH